MAPLETIGVVGAGQMGSGIAQVSAQAGFTVWMRDLEPALLQHGLGRIERDLRRAADKGRLRPEEVPAVLERIRTTTALEDLAGCDFVVEAIVEDLDAKLETFRALDRICREEVILASNTSSLPITRLAAATRRPERVIGMHFMNPVPVMKLVEVVRGLATSDETRDAVVALAEKLGKTPVECRDSPGFVSNRVLVPMINEAVWCLYEGIAEREAIDTIMKLGMHHPMGPLELADFIGLDTCLAILEVLHEGLGEDKYRPCPLLRRYVEAGRLGRKTGRGFYDYTAGR